MLPLRRVLPHQRQVRQHERPLLILHVRRVRLPCHAGEFGALEQKSITPSSGIGVFAAGRTGIRAQGNDFGLFAESSVFGSTGIVGQCFQGFGVEGTTGGLAGRAGVRGVSSGASAGVWGETQTYAGVSGFAASTSAVNYGVFGSTASSATGAIGVYGIANASTGTPYGVVGRTLSSNASAFGVYSLNNLGAPGRKNFHIDHPKDPANKFLVHSSVEGPDSLLMYTGTVTLDADGTAIVQLPSYFEDINKDPRYQLTPIGAPALLFVADEIRDNRFKIAGGQPGMKVSWAITGIRNDAWARRHPDMVEVDKEPLDKGKYIVPELYNMPEELSLLPLPPKPPPPPSTPATPADGTTPH